VDRPPDGYLAVVRVNPFRVDWRSPDGRMDAWRSLPIRNPDERTREAGQPGTHRASSRRGRPPRQDLQKNFRHQNDEWPDVMPPFIEGRCTSPRTVTCSFGGHPRDFPASRTTRGSSRQAARNPRTEEQRDHWGLRRKVIYIIETDADDLRFIRAPPLAFYGTPWLSRNAIA
jgi:hypothetical protein